MRAWTDERVEQMIGTLLRWGVVLAAAVVLAGGAVHLHRHGTGMPDFRVFRGEPMDLRTVPGILREAASGSGRGLIQLGLLLLVAVPIARVAFSVAAFAMRGDRAYVAVTLVVLALLLFGLGRAGP